MNHRALVGLALLGLALAALARVGTPEAPPLYDGIAIAPEPFRYCAPPSDLASTNKPPASGHMDLQQDSGGNKLATVQTDDKQVLAFFPAGGLPSTAGKLGIKISPECTSPPPPPAGDSLVGNVYRVEVAGVTPPAALLKPAQVLLRIPPVKLSAVQEYYDGAWHDTQWSVQTDYINLSIDHLGLIAAFDDGKHSQPAPPQQAKFNPIGAIEAALVVVAIVIVVAGIVVQRRRTKAVDKAAYRGGKTGIRHGGGKDRKGGSTSDDTSGEADWGPRKRR